MHNEGQPFQLGELGEWTDLDRAILGNVLGCISVDSFLRGGFLASALAVSKTTREPSEGFKALAQDAGLLRTTVVPRGLDKPLEVTAKTDPPRHRDEQAMPLQDLSIRLDRRPGGSPDVTTSSTFRPSHAVAMPN